MKKLKINRGSQAVLSGNTEWETDWDSEPPLAMASVGSIQFDCVKGHAWGYESHVSSIEAEALG